LYETMPLAFIMEQAGGKAFSGMTRILDIVPKDIHERSAFEAGSPFEMGWYHEVMRRVGAA
jgi:fructose-1,6-bisphosphatase I